MDWQYPDAGKGAKETQMNDVNREQTQRAKNAILGAFVADAATMGMHWLYSQRRIIELAPEHPEFREPDEQDFVGNVGYFAHAGKTVGEFSQYGEQAWVMLNSMTMNNGHYEKHHYQDVFRDHFGYGGQFRGYIDRPTRETLDTIYRSEYDALEKAGRIPFDGDRKQKPAILIKMLAAAKQYRGERLKQQAEVISAAFEDSGACLSYALSLIDALQGTDDFPGAKDEQLPAISKLPVLIARYSTAPDLHERAISAVKVTNNTARALDYGMICTTVLSSLVNGYSITSAINSGLQTAHDESRDQLSTALSRNCGISELTKEFGLHCDLGSGMSSILFNLKSSVGYAESIRSNIIAGGDNCGRSIMLGAALGAVYGVGGDKGIPDAWVTKVHGHEKLKRNIDGLFT